ncbi:MAG: hypothetical protein EBU49_09640 [Proteobacteria bacterium]|nr:hypothetical protein [Pseudomonadota bacterium]
MAGSNMKRRLITGGICFAGGMAVWLALNGHKISEVRERDVPSFDNLNRGSILVEVADTPINSDDLEWEYNLHTKGMTGTGEMTPIPDLGSKLEKELSPLKQSLLAGMIERKLLFKYLQQDRKFDLEDPSRFTSCLKEWQTSLESSPELFQTNHSKELLKNRLCERSIILQYTEARIFPLAAATDAQITEYYKNHQPEFRFPPRATIRQVVLADEASARKIKREINQHNFQEMARQHSITPEGAGDGGKVGPFAKGEVPAVFDVSFEMQPGQISEILKSTYGFHIIMLQDKRPRHELSLKEATPKIRAIVTAKRKEEEYRKWLEAALNSIPITSPRS